MATLHRPTPPAFRAVNAMDIATNEPPPRNMATPRSQLITPPPPPPPPQPQPQQPRLQHPQQQQPGAAPAFELPAPGYTTPPANMDASPAAPPAMDEVRSPPADSCSNAHSDNSDDVSDKDRSSSEPAGKAATQAATQAGGTPKGSNRLKNKKKGTKFHCTGYSPCNLSFTRSEHLARHVRKHTGERPFMCHCGRWFSRLDNLRQHATTVHADEDIPHDSLAATGTRYQRHGRSERIRPRSRAHSQSDLQPPPEQEMQSTPPALGSPIADRPPRRRPDPIVVHRDLAGAAAGQDEATAAAAAFNQYRDHTPPDSPASTTTTSSYFNGPYRTRTAYPPPLSEISSPADTPTSSRMSGGSALLDSPFVGQRNSLMFDASHPSIASSRRLSMPMPPTPGLLNEVRAMTLPAPRSGSGSPSASASTHSRRDSLTSVIAQDDRRRTWHLGSPSNYTNYMNPVSPPRDVATATHNLSRVAIHSPTGSTFSPVSPSRSQQTDRLPSIHHVLQTCRPPPPRTPEQQQQQQQHPQLQQPHHHQHHNHHNHHHQQQQQHPQQTVSWASNILERSPTLGGRSFDDSIPAPMQRHVAPGQVRSRHGRSISNIETRGWGPGAGHNNPFSGPGYRAEREARRDLSVLTPLSAESNRNLGYSGGPLPSIPSPREHRQSFGSSDSSISEGLVTPVAHPTDISRPVIMGEPGEAVFNNEMDDRSCEMTGVESTGPSGCTPVTPFDALVSVAAGATKI